ncbi:MAG: archaellin/type IV pilin N-terminal domain-containing protein, partial [Candidatus Aenigmatarchaeota archaeon]
MIKEKNKSLNLKGVSPIIAVILLVMIVIGMGLTAYLFFSRTQETLQKGTEEQAGKAFEAMYSKIKIESVTKEKIYIRNAGSFEINSTSLTLYVNNETYSFTIGTEILEPNRVYALQLSQPLGEQDYLIKVTAGAGIEDSRYVNLAITTTTTTTSIPITITTTTIPPGVTTTTTT